MGRDGAFVVEAKVNVPKDVIVVDAGPDNLMVFMILEG